MHSFESEDNDDDNCDGFVKETDSVKRKLVDNSNPLLGSVKKSKVFSSPVDDNDDDDDDHVPISRRINRCAMSTEKSFSFLKKQLVFVEKSFEEFKRKRRVEEKRLKSIESDIVECDKELGDKKKLAGCVRRINEIHKKMMVKIDGCVKDFVAKEAQLCLIEELIGERRQELKMKEMELRRVMIDISKEREFESQMKELVDDLVLKQKHFESRVDELKAKERQWKGQVKELESKEKSFDGRVKQFDSKENQFEARVKEMEFEKKHFESRSKDLESKEKQHERRVKEHGSKAREFECQVKELKSKIRHFGSQLEELKSKEIQLEGKVKEVENKEKQIDVRAKEFDSKEDEFEVRVKELELQKKQFDGRVKEFDSKEDEFKGRVKEFDSKEMEFEGRVKELESEKKHLDGRVKEFNSKEDEFEGRMKELKSEKKHFKSLLKALESKERQFKGQMKDFESKEEEFKDQVKVFESKEEEFESRVKEFNSKERQYESKIEDLKSKEKQFEERWKALKSKEKQFEGQVMNPESNLNKHEEKETATSYMDDESSPTIDETSLQLVLCEQTDILASLRESSDPAKVVLDIILNPIIPLCDKKGDNAVIIDDRCIYLLEPLMKISPNIKPSVREEAMKLALDLKATIKGNTENSLAVLGFLLVLSIYGLVTSFDEDDILELFVSVAHHKIALELFRSLSFANKVSDLSFIQKKLTWFKSWKVEIDLKFNRVSYSFKYLNVKNEKP